MADKRFDIQEFRANAANSYHRTSHFNLSIGMPFGMRTGVSGDQFTRLEETWKNLNFEIESVNIPGIALGTDENRRQGFGPYSLKPYVAIFDSVNLVVRSDSDGKNYDFFQSWMKLITNYDSRSSITGNTGIGNTGVYEISYARDYHSEAYINVYNEEGDRTIMVSMTKAYPIHLGNAVLDWGSNSILRFPVTLTFTDWFQERAIGTANTQPPQQ